jgi:hypothetical protein
MNAVLMLKSNGQVWLEFCEEFECHLAVSDFEMKSFWRR